MTQTITQQPSKTWANFKLYGLILIFVFLGYSGVYSQTISWTTGYPKLNPATLTALGDPGDLEVYFTPTAADITSAKLEVTLPTGVNYLSIENAPEHTASITYGTPSSVGQVVTVSFTSNGNSLKAGQPVSLRLKVSATCAAVNASSAIVKVLSTNTLVSLGQKAVTIGVQVPTVRVQSTEPTQNYANQTDIKDFELSLDAQNGEASSFKLTLTGDQYTTLSNFTLDGTSITPTSLNILSGTSRITVITVTSADMGGGKLGTTVRKLKFSAANTRCGARNITTSVQYPSTSNCNTQTGATLTMSFPAESGVPFMDYVNGSAGYYDAINGTSISIFTAPKDLVTTTYLKLSFKNTGSADAYETLMTSLGFYGSVFGYIDPINIKYSIDGGTLQSITAGMLSGGEILQSTSSTHGYLKPEYVGKFLRRNLTIPDVIPVGSTITVWIPAYLGNVYDNTGKNVFYNYHTRAPWGIKGYATAKNRCELQGTGETSAYSRITYSSSDIFFRELPAPMVVRANQTLTQTVRLVINNHSTNVNSYVVSEMFIEMPDWMDLNGTVENAIKLKTLDGATTYSAIAGSGQDYGVNVGKHKYSLKFSNLNNTNINLSIDYKAGACQSSTANQIDQILYWINWQQGASNQPMQNVSQVIQKVTMLCKVDGVVLDNFSSTRTTIGLKDSNDDHKPDDGTPALTSEIRNDYYLLNDEGYLKWNATIDGPASTTYTHWYAPVTLTSMNLTQMIPTGGSCTISINNGAPIPVIYTQVDNSKFYLHYDGSVTPLKGGDKIEVRLPFVIRATNNYYYYMNTECFVSNIPFSYPFTSLGNINRHGEDVAPINMGLYDSNFYYNYDNQNPVFPNNNIKTDIYHGLISYFHNSYPLNFFEKEVRNKYYLDSVYYEMPEGYIITNNLKVTYLKQDAPTSNPGVLIPAISTDNNVYTYNPGALYDTSYDGSGTLAAGKYMIPDDKWSMTFYPSIRATKGATLGATNGKRTMVLRNVMPGGKDTTFVANFPLSYTGLATTLNLSTDTLSAYSPKLFLPVMNIGNPNTVNLNNIWLYVDGNVSNISITPVGGGTSISGQGYEGRWIKVSTLMTAGTTLPYQMDFIYGGSTDCTVKDKVKIYTVSGFDDPTWDPSTNGAINSALVLTDYDHVGANKSLFIKSAPASISGKISVSNSTITFNTPYTLTVSIDALGSQGALKDHQIKLTIPAGQKYVAGSAKIEYPLGTTPVVSTALDALLAATNSTIDSDVILNIGSNFTLPGYLGIGTDADRQVRITANFAPQCETVLTGMRFKGIISGKNSCGDAAAGDGTVVFTPQIFPNIVNNYTFNVNSTIIGNNLAFNEIRTTGTLNVTLNKITGPTDNMANSDFLLLTLPKEFNFSSASIISGIGTGAVTILSNTAGATERLVRLSLPVAAYNAATNKGVGQDVIYEIPFIYTPNGQSLATNPEQDIIASVVSNLQFDVSCPSVEASIGNKTLAIAVVTAKQAPFMACLNTEKEMKITSAGFQGSWYAFSDLSGAVLSSTSILNYTPAIQQDTAFYLSAIFSGMNYGTVPVAVKVNPLPTITLVTNKTNDEVSVNSDITLTTESGKTSYTWDLGGATTITSGGNTTNNTAVLQWNSAGIKTVTVNYTDANGCTGTTATSTPVSVIENVNQDASLKDLKVDGVTLPDFNPTVTSYMATVICNEEQVTILGVPNDANVTSITGNGTFSLQPGDNIFSIVVVAQDGTTTKTYTVNVIRDCHAPKILKDLEDTVICVGNSHTFEIQVEGLGLTYEWYYGLNRIIGANTNTYTVNAAELRDYELYQVVIRSNYNGFKSSVYSKKARLWVADYLPTTLKFAEYPNPATTGSTYHIKVDGYVDVTKYTWSYSKEGVSFSPGASQVWSNEAWATFGTLAAGTGTLKVTMEHPCGTRELSQAITVKYPTGVEDVTATMIQVYPNPTAGIVKISNTEANQTIRIMDVTGSLKGIYKTQEGTTTIDLTGYAKGTYMIQYNSKTYKVIRK